MPIEVSPTSIALVTDYVFQDEQMLRYSLAYVPPVVLIVAAIIGFLCVRPYVVSLDYLQAWSDKNEKQ